jgi:hypothetical protein
VLTGWSQNPVQSARLDALLPREAADTFRNLAATVETAKRAPVASAVNTSNTGSAVVNAAGSMLRNSALAHVAGKWAGASGIPQGLAAARNQTDLTAALNPGVSLKAIMSSTPAQAERSRVASRLLTPAAAVALPQAGDGQQD